MATILVRRQIVDVDVFGDESMGTLLQHRLSRVCADVVGPELESALAPFDPETRVLRIDRIDVDLADIALSGLEGQFEVAIRKAFAGYVRDCRLEVLSDQQAGTDVRLVTRLEEAEDALVRFLASGRLPWSLTLPPGEDLEALVRREWREVSSAGPSAWLCQRLTDVFRDPGPRMRLTLQFTPQFAVLLLRSLSPPVADAAGSALAAVDVPGVVSEVRRTVSLKIWDIALDAAAHDECPSSADLLRDAILDAGLSPMQVAKMTDAVEPEWPDVVAALRMREPPRPRTDAERTLMPGRTEASDEIAEGESILVSGAGLVLLHPYLQRFFTGLDIAVGDELIDPHRAVCLLHHLATGETVAPEHQTTLGKILCGIPLEQPVPAEVELTDAETTEATVLLEAVVANWGALGGASPDGLREGFLRRDGVLSVDDWGDWLLRVERKSIDVLLDALTWPVSMVALPWMARRIVVDWL